MQTSSSRLPGAGLPGDLTRNRLRNRALQLFAERGFSNISIRELARHLGITPGAFYHHCNSKEELLFELIAEHYLAVQALIERNQHLASSRNALQQVVYGLLARHKSSPGSFVLSTRDLNCLPETDRNYVEGIRQRIQQALARLLSTLRLEQQDPTPAVALPALQLLEHLPVWLNDTASDSQARCQLALSLLGIHHPHSCAIVA